MRWYRGVRHYVFIFAKSPTGPECSDALWFSAGRLEPQIIWRVGLLAALQCRHLQKTSSLAVRGERVPLPPETPSMPLHHVFSVPGVFPMLAALWPFSPSKVKTHSLSTLLHCGWKCKLAQPLWRTVGRFLKTLRIEPPYDTAISLLGTHPENNMIWKDTCTPMFNAALFTIAKTWKQPKCPSINKWIKKMWCVYISYIYGNGILLSH